MALASWLLVFSGVPTLLVLGYFLLARQWVRWLGRPALATVLHAEPVATLPHLVTEVTLEMLPYGEPDYVRIRRSVRWSERTAHPDRLTPGTQLRVRYRLARETIVMPDARSR